MSKNKVLVIEDDGDMRLGYQILLKAHGYDTAFAGDSLSAMSEARMAKVMRKISSSA